MQNPDEKKREGGPFKGFTVLDFLRVLARRCCAVALPDLGTAFVGVIGIPQPLTVHPAFRNDPR